MKRLPIIQLAISLLFIIVLALGLIQHEGTIFGSKTIIQNFSFSGDSSLEDFYNRGQELGSGGQSAKTAVTFLAVGDIMLSRNVALAIQNQNDVNYPFAKLPEIFNPPSGSHNFAFGNLESPVAPKKPIVGGHTMVFGAPVDYLTGLKKANFKILNLANNHALDQELSGLLATKKGLDDLGIAHMGTGNNLGQAWEPAVVNAGGIKICFVGASYSSVNDSGKTKNNYVARTDQLDWLKTAVATAKQECDFTVVTMHAGTEYTRNPNSSQTAFAHAAIDNGADIVIGAHPHWIQTVEAYCPNQNTTSPPPLSLKGEGNCPNPKYIFYSLGNFIFDQDFSVDTSEGLTLKITLSKTGCSLSPLLRGDVPSAADLFDKTQGLPDQGGMGEGQRGCSDNLQGQKTQTKLEQIELLPVIIENYSTPRLANEEETKKILKKINLTENILK